jgi:hypothetical protein
MNDMPIITLSNGLRVANFSSPHPFRFTDGSELPECSPERARVSKLQAHEVETDRGLWTDIDLEFVMSDECESMLREAWKLWRAGEVDIVIVPFPVLNAWKATKRMDVIKPHGHPFRTIRCADRVTKLNHCDRFCA